MYLLGCDIGCSSVKVSIVEAESGLTVGSDHFPKTEAPIKAIRIGWAEQNPDDWWFYIKSAIQGALGKSGIRGEEIKAIGIAYQMFITSSYLSRQFYSSPIGMDIGI